MNEIMTYFKQQLDIQDVDLRTYSPLVLAYIGDAIYELIIRTKIVTNGNQAVHKMHIQSSQLVKATTQAKIMSAIEPFLSEEEHKIYKRGRNAKSATNPKNVSVLEYRIATGFETLIGYLYLKEEYIRIIDIIREGLETLKM